MNPSKVVRDEVVLLTHLPNVGESLAADLHLIGIHTPGELKGRDPYAMFEALCAATQQRHDPCVIDVFISMTRFMNGAPPAVWWQFTEERKQALQRQGDAPR